MHGMQTEELRYFQEQEKRRWKDRDAEILQILQEAYFTQGSEITERFSGNPDRTITGGNSYER